MSYKREELLLKDDSQEEQVRTRLIFEDLKKKAQNGEEMSEHEKDFFCQGVKLSRLDDGRIEHYDCCSNFKFKITYLAYFHDLSGHSSYQKVQGTKLYNPERNEISNDIAYLARVEASWRNTINITNHKSELLQQISKEARQDLNALEKAKGKLIFRRDRERFQLDRRKIILQSKYIYCMALQIFEMFEPDDFILNLNGEEIEINEYSVIHIIGRHFAQTTKPNPEKSFHIEDFAPKYLNKQLKNILNEIDESGALAGESINKVAFQYKNIDYIIWINERTKQVKGKGNVSYYRLETFYPVEDANEISDLKTSYSLEMVNEELSVYVKK